STNSTEIYQEGLQFACLRLFSEGEVNDPLLKFIETNVRHPEISIGDLWAQVASLRTREKSVKELCEKYESEVIIESIDRYLDHGQILALKEIDILPERTFELSDFIYDDGITDDQINIQIIITITENELISYFTGTDTHVQGPINSTYTGLVS